MARMSVGLLTIGAGLFVATTARAADTPRVSFGTGISYSQGDYGTGNTSRTTSIPLSARLRTGQFRFSARMPYLFRSGSGRMVDENGVPIEDEDVGDRETRRGFGDLTIGAAYALPKRIGGVEVELGTSVKLPTSKRSKRFGTGKTDVAFSTDLSLPLKKATPFLGLGYRIRGDDEDFRLRNTISASAGSSFNLGRFTATASYEYFEASRRSRKDGHAIFGSLGRRIDPRFYVTAYASKGLSDGAADFASGVLVSFRPR